MNTHKVLRFPRIEMALIALVLLALVGFSILISLGGLLIHVRSSQSAIQADPIKMVDAFHSAVNNDTIDATTALFAVDATVSDNGSIFQGRDEIRNWFLYSPHIAECHLRMIYSQVVGEKVVWRDMAKNGSNESYILQWMAVIEEGKIKSLAVSLLPMPDGK